MESPQKPSDNAKLFSRLAHLAALNRTQRLAGAIDSLVLATLNIDPDLASATTSDLTGALEQWWGLRLPGAQVDEAVARLRRGRQLLPDGESHWKLAPEVQTRFEARRIESRALEVRVRDEWLVRVQANGIELTPVQRVQLWKHLQTYLFEMFNRHGVRALQLVGVQALAATGPDSHAALLLGTATGQALEELSPALRDAFQIFFDDMSEDVTRFLAQLMDGTFAYLALTVDDQTATYLKSGLQPLKVFLDTNFVFALLGIHREYFVDLSRQLMALIRENRLPFTLYCHESTLKEYREVLRANRRRLASEDWTKMKSAAALSYSGSGRLLSGIEVAFHRANEKSKIGVAEFLERYEHVEALLSSHGVVIFREPPTERSGETLARQATLVREYEQFLRKVNRDGRGPATMRHDMALWMALQRIRHDASSVLDEGAILLTNDYALYAFDWARLKDLDETQRVGTVVVAPQFLQILRPFVPATNEFDRHFVADIAEVEFRAAAPDFSPIVGKVLSYLEEEDDLPEKVALRILADDVLMTRLLRAEDAPHFFDLLDEAISDGLDMAEDEAESQAGLGSDQVSQGATSRPGREPKHLRKLARAERERDMLRAALCMVASALAIAVVFGTPVVFPVLGGGALALKLQILALALAMTLIAGVLYKRYRRTGLVLATLVAILIGLSQVLP